MSFRVTYSVNSFTGAIISLEFPDASSHGSAYSQGPAVRVSDAACRCGTTITELSSLYGGEGYTSGIVTMSGNATKQAPTTGSGFLAHFWTMGNITEVTVRSSGTGFTSEPSIQIRNDDAANPTGSGGAGAEAVALLKVVRILLLRPGALYLRAPRVLVESPQADGGRRAQAEVIMEEDVHIHGVDPFHERQWGPGDFGTQTRYRVKAVVVTDPGFGYTRLPGVLFEDHEQEDPMRSSYTSFANASAMAVMEIDKVVVNHDYRLSSLLFRDKPELVLLQRNYEKWFGSPAGSGTPPQVEPVLRKQNEQYLQTLSGSGKAFMGITATTKAQHISTLQYDSNVTDGMVPLCESCWLDSSWMPSLNLYQKTNSTLGLYGFTRTWLEPKSRRICLDNNTWVAGGDGWVPKGAGCDWYALDSNRRFCKAGSQSFFHRFPAEHAKFSGGVVTGSTSDAVGAQAACCACGGGEDVVLG